MTTATGYPLRYNEPRTIWTISLQLFYTILAMLPFYFYLTNLIEVPNQGTFLLQYLPIAVGILLFFIQQMLNDYNWNQIKIYKDRDIFVAALKSTILTLSMFYFIFFYIFAYSVGNSGYYEEDSILQDVITRTMVQLMITLGTILVTAIMMVTIQRDGQAGRKFGDRFRRR